MHNLGTQPRAHVTVAAQARFRVWAQRQHVGGQLQAVPWHLVLVLGAACLMCCRLPRRYPCIDTCAAQAHLVRGCSQALRWVISSTPLTVSRVYCTVCLHCTVCIMLCCTVLQVSTDGSQFVMLCADSRIRIFVLQVAWTCVPHRCISQHGATSHSAINLSHPLDCTLMS